MSTTVAPNERDLRARIHSPRECSETMLARAFDHLEIEEAVRHLIRTPHLEIIIELPLIRGDGTLAVFRGYRVQHDNSRGPYKGGLRYHPDVDLDHFLGLAQVMTWKTALLDLPLGGAKGGINCDPEQLTPREREVLTKRFALRLGRILGPNLDIPAPDMGSGEHEMAWIYEAFSLQHGDEPGVVTGKPVELGGCPLRGEATGRGLAYVCALALDDLVGGIAGRTFAIQGFGAVGRHAARRIEERGGVVVAASDVDGGLHRAEGLDCAALAEAAERSGARRLPRGVVDADALTNADLLALDVDVLIPAATDGVIDLDVADKVRARFVVEGANLPITCDADEALARRGVVVIPGILANAGGVIVSYVEWIQNRQRYRWPDDKVVSELEQRLRQAWMKVHQHARTNRVSHRLGANAIAIDRVRRATELRGF